VVSRNPQPMSDEYATVSNAPVCADRTLERELGSQIRAIRKKQDLSVSTLAASAGISSGMLSKIENGQISASLTTLHALANALSTPISLLFSSVEERQDSSLVKAGQGVVIERRGTKSGHVYRLLGHVLRGDVVLEPYLITLNEGAQPYPSFRHAGIEFLFMLEGELIYRHGSETYHLKAGDSFLFDSGALHGPEDMPVLPARYLSIIVYPRSAD
jgi:transcriptional regulator with XRE-family HTH domain